MMPFVSCPFKVSRLVVVISLAMTVLAVGCVNAVFIEACKRHTVHVETSAPLLPGSALAVDIHNGCIAVTGADVETCSLAAEVEGRASTEARAKELAEATKVTLEKTGVGLEVKVTYPKLSRRESVSIDMELTVPKNTALDLNAHNGRITVRDIDSPVKVVSHNGVIDLEDISAEVAARTHNGAITCRRIAALDLESHNGAVRCEDVSGDVAVRAHNGKIRVACAPSASPARNISLVTHNGSVELVVPKDLSASVRIAVRNGRVQSNLPLRATIKGRTLLEGSVGDGEGSIEIETYNGSVKVRQAAD